MLIVLLENDEIRSRELLEINLHSQANRVPKIAEPEFRLLSRVMYFSDSFYLSSTVYPW